MLTDQDVNAAVVAVDGIGACDPISRNAMLEGLLRVEGGDQIPVRTVIPRGPFHVLVKG